MTSKEPLVLWKVTWIESERGWGSRVDDVQYYLDEKTAKDAAHRTNSMNTASAAPDYYVRAEVAKEVVPSAIVSLIIEDYLKQRSLTPNLELEEVTTGPVSLDPLPVKKKKVASKKKSAYKPSKGMQKMLKNRPKVVKPTRVHK